MWLRPSAEVIILFSHIESQGINLGAFWYLSPKWLTKCQINTLSLPQCLNTGYTTLRHSAHWPLLNKHSFVMTVREGERWTQWLCNESDDGWLPPLTWAMSRWVWLLVHAVANRICYFCHGIWSARPTWRTNDFHSKPTCIIMSSAWEPCDS